MHSKNPVFYQALLIEIYQVQALTLVHTCPVDWAVEYTDYFSAEE